ncbi:MAG: hypothetical protein AABX38_02625 [Candidatus Micrarchaeota archaeon]
MHYIIEPCATAKAFEIKFGKTLDLEKLAGKFKENEVFSLTKVVLLVKINQAPVSIYASGRAMVKEATKEETQKIAEKLGKMV